MATFLVTGGAGFIGSHLVHALIAQGDAVRVVDDLSTGREANLADVAGRFEMLRGDIADAELVAKATAGCDYVLHQAALPSVPRSLEAPLDTDRVNVHGTLVLLEAARRAVVKRVVYAASSAAYGETPTLPKVETLPPDPLSPYAVSKLAAEHYMKVYHRCYGLQTVALRYFNVFGPRQDPQSHYAAVIPRFVTAALEGRAPIVYGDGQQSRDFCYVDNAVEANLRAVAAPEAAVGRVYNVAVGERVTLLEVLAQLSALLGRRIEPLHEPARAGDIKHSLADIGAARAALGYSAAIKFSEGLRRTLEWYRAQSGAR